MRSRVVRLKLQDSHREMLNCNWNCRAVFICFWLFGLSQAQQHVDELGMRTSIPIPEQPMYYLMTDAGPNAGAKDELRRTNRCAWKWWGKLFNQNNCCNNNNNSPDYNNNLPSTPSPLNPLGLDGLCNDPFKDLKLFKKLPDIWGNNWAGQCNQCDYQQPAQNYEAPPQPADYKPPSAPYSSDYENPKPAYDGPGDGNDGYVAPAAPPAAPEYEKPTDEPSAPSYEPPIPPATYEQDAPAPESYNKGDDYGQSGKSYGGAESPKFVYQPIIYVQTSDAKIEKDKYQQQQQQPYQPEPPAPVPAPAYETPAPADVPVYAPPSAQTPAVPYNAPSYAGYLPLVTLPVYGYPAPAIPPPAAAYAAPPPAAAYAAPPPAAAYAAPPPADAYAAPSPAVYTSPPSYSSPCTTCQTPIRLSVVDQPYRVAPELFREYNYRLDLGGQQRSY